MPRSHLKRRLINKRKRSSFIKYSCKRFRYSKENNKIDVLGLFEDTLYNLNTSAMHLKLYIKRLMYEYCGDTRDEIAVFYAMAVNLYKETSDAYYNVMNNQKNVIEINTKDMQDKYDGILDLCGITADEIYNALFDENDDGYETPPREGEERSPASLCEEIEETTDEEKPPEDELYKFAIDCINKKLSIN